MQGNQRADGRSVDQDAAAVTTALTGVDVMAWALHVSGQSDNNSDNGAGCG
jgi:hypothetical protein